MSKCQEQREKLDRIYSKSISKSISDVIRFSLDESFRKNAYKLFGVQCTADTEKEINKKLLALFQNKTATRNRDKEDKIDLEAEFSNKTPDCNAEKSTEIQSKNKEKNWLFISSEQYKESLKRRKACFYSQPQKVDIFDLSNYQPSTSFVLPLFNDSGSNYKEKAQTSFNSNQVLNIRSFSQ